MNYVLDCANLNIFIDAKVYFKFYSLECILFIKKIPPKFCNLIQNIFFKIK